MNATRAALDCEITYGKAGVPVYRSYGRPLEGVPVVPESPFRGRDNVLFACEVDVEVFGDNFLPAYTEGDNSMVVATDSIKNFVIRHGAVYEGATLEGFVHHVGRELLVSYPQMTALRVRALELRFDGLAVPNGDGFRSSDVLRWRSPADRSLAELRIERGEDGAPTIDGHRCGRLGMELLKVKGSAFTRFVRDEYTTLPERSDRPLYIGLDVEWAYGDVADAVRLDEYGRYVDGEQVRDVCAAVFDEFVSESIQHLVHEIGLRLLDRYPQLRAVSFTSRNMTRDPYATSDVNPEARAYSDPFPAFGTITLTLTRGS